MDCKKYHKHNRVFVWDGKWGMKKKKEKKNLYVFIVYIVLLAIIPITFVFSNSVGETMDKHIIDTMENSADLCVELIEGRYETDMQMIESLAMQLSLSFDNPERAMERMSSFAERYGMKRVAFSYPDGVTLTTDGSELNMKGGKNFELALQGESVLSTAIVDRADGKMINVYVCPVYHKDTDEILGVLASVYHSDIFEDILTASSFDGEGYTYIIDSAGDIIINSHHSNAIPEMENIYEYVKKYDDNAASSLKTQLENHGEGFFEIKRDGQHNLYTYYKKISVSDWYVFCTVPEEFVEETKIAVMTRVLGYCMVMFVCAVVIVLSIQYVLKVKNKQLEKALYVDPLTGGRSYEKFCIDCMKRLKKDSNKNAAFIFLDIDNFNLISTLYGYEESVENIRRIYSIIQDCVGEKGIIGRNSSDQFCVMYFYDDPEECEKILRNFFKNIHDNARFETMLRPSMGIYIVEDHDEDIHIMLNKARTAHETVKYTDDTIIAYYDTSFRDKKYQNKHMEKKMEDALEANEFVPYFQPKYDAKTGKICGAEALVRWITTEGNIIPPGQFIPLAENNGFVRELDKTMFVQVCNLQKKLIEHGITPVPISVNVSRQLLYDKSFADYYCNYMKEVDIPADLVELEITESAFFEDIDLFRTTLEKLRNFGFKILMDDFGTGYSSLMMLHSVPIDVIKLDKSFIDDYEDEKGSSIIQCVLNLASMLKLPVVAEGVETKDQYIYLKDSGCDVIQGFYFSKPLSADEFYKKTFE